MFTLSALCQKVAAASGDMRKALCVCRWVQHFQVFLHRVCSYYLKCE